MADIPSTGVSIPRLHDKENARNYPRHSPVSFTKTPSLGRRRVLRYGETMEALFLLDANSDTEHRKLCRQIVDGTSADDPVCWKKVLDVSVEQAKPESNEGLLRLCRRVTSRFPVDSLTHQDEIFTIWLHYARVQQQHGALPDAQLTLRHLLNHKIGQEKAEVYLYLSQVETQLGNAQAGREVLRSGINRNAHPIESLRDALEKYSTPRKRRLEQQHSPKRRKKEDGSIEERDEQDSSNMSLDTDGIETSLEVEDTIGLNNTKDSIRFQLAPMTRQPSTLIHGKSAANQANYYLSTKMTKNNEGSRETSVASTITETVGWHIGEKSLVQEKIDNENAVPNIPLSKVLLVNGDEMNPSLSGPTDSHQNLPSNKTDDLSRKTPEDQRQTFAQTPVSISKTPGQFIQIKSTRITSVGRNDAAKLQPRRPPLLSKTPRLSKIGLSGKALRVDPSQSMVQSDSESEVESAIVSEIKEPAKKTSNRKIKKLDLSYMWEWDPNKPRKQNADESSMQGVDNELGKPEELQPTHSSSTGSHSHLSSASNNPSDEKMRRASDVKMESCQDSSEAAPQSIGLHGHCNPDFLPLVNEKNMLRVNNIPYAKLGVIGKGGSCKVYRALSKDCSVLAIKKVKLAGMDRKTIDGYANEIALLKRLRGNPSIIQMYDSEVDIQRQAIFLVMELGEVDLNHVLQQQALLEQRTESGDCRHLNMNFIRLTWHQMLSAVHAIHEERIIHGDLKPANFLFVRGALKLIDFGIAKAIQNDDTTNIYRESQIGTLNYMSPEAILDTGTGQNGARMKIGRMVYGRTPFSDLHMIQKLQAIVNPNHAIDYPPNADEDAVDAIKTCLRRNPDDRPPIIGKYGLLNEHQFLNSRRKT